MFIRYEKSGELSGLIRVRAMTINDAHIYCRRDQIFAELKAVIQMQLEFFSSFKIQPHKFRLSLRHDPSDVMDTVQNKADKFIGEDEIWEEAESCLKKALEETGIEYEVGYGEAAFYGPKIDTQFRSLSGREETLSTIQLDFLAAKNLI